MSGEVFQYGGAMIPSVNPRERWIVFPSLSRLIEPDGSGGVYIIMCKSSDSKVEGAIQQTSSPNHEALLNRAKQTALRLANNRKWCEESIMVRANKSNRSFKTFPFILHSLNTVSQKFQSLLNNVQQTCFSVQIESDFLFSSKIESVGKSINKIQIFKMKSRCFMIFHKVCG